MKQFLLLFSLVCFQVVFAQSTGIFQTYVITNQGVSNNYFHGGQNADTSPSNFDGHGYGSVTQLTLNGGEVKSWKNNGADVTGAKLYYRVYVSSPLPDPLPNFIEIDLPYDSELGFGNQKWTKTDSGINILNNLTPSESYTFEVFWKITNEGADDVYDSNSGSNFKATFTVDPSLDLKDVADDAKLISVYNNQIMFHKDGNYEIVIYDLSGRRVLHDTKNVIKSQKIDLFLDQGLYIIQAKLEEKTTNTKMLVY